MAFGVARILPFVLGSALVACGPASEGIDGDSSRAAVVDGHEARWEHAEIGHFEDCTGTLVASNVVLSAAHCFEHVSGVRSVGDFVVELASGSRAFATAEVIVLGDDTGARDLALVRLATHVPDDVARPTSIARRTPAPGAPVSLWGYGCTSRPSRIAPSQPGAMVVAGDAETKRKAAFAWGEPSMHACPGDSGGPVLDAAGDVVGVASAYIPVEEGGGDDIFAEPVSHRAELQDRITRWHR